MWGTLQAHRIMSEYRSEKFSGHPKIALILHEHLINFSVPMSMFVDWQKKVKEDFSRLELNLGNEIQKALRVANSANSTANKKKS